MVLIRITKDGRILRDENYDNNSEKANKIIEIDTLKNSLGCFLVIEEGTTFETFFNLILKDKEFYDTVYHEQLHRLSISEFEKEFQKKPSKKKDDLYKLIKYLEIGKNIDYFTHTGEIDVETIEVYSVINAIGSKENDDNELIINVGMIPLNELKNYTLTVNYETSVFTVDEEDDPEVGGQIEISVGDAIDAILFQITSYGIPKQRNKIKKQALQEYNEGDQIDTLKEKLNKAISSEKFELAEEIQKSIDELEKNKPKDENRN